jgi:ABC-type multidrug transport system ATPase subunit
MNTLKVENISKCYDKKSILNDISFECNTNEVLAFFGRNGSGKSTLLELIYGTIKADSIKIMINGETINPSKVISSNKIAYLPQTSFLPKNLKVSEVITMYFKNGYEQDKIFYSPRINEIQSKKTGSLSLGELRYLEIILISNLNHQFLMLDEPFSMVEPLYIELIKELFKSLKKEKGIILTDHYYSDTLEIADHLFLIKNNKKIIINHRADLITNGYLNH